MENILITDEQLDNMVKDRVSQLRNNISLLKENLRKIYNGDNYVDPKNYMSNGILNPEKYTPEMKKRFLKKCKPENSKIGYCKNSSCDWCFLKSESCFNDTFNEIPTGAFDKSFHYMQVNGWKNNTLDKLKQIIMTF